MKNCLQVLNKTKEWFRRGIREIEWVAYPRDMSSEEYARRVAEKAYELYQKRGCLHGCDQEDWFEAERLVMQETGKFS